MPDTLESTSNVPPAEASYVERLCPLCQCDNHQQPASEFSRPPWRIKSCGDCGFVYLENTLSYEQLVADEHAWSQSLIAERQLRRQREPIFDRVSLTWRKLRSKLIPRREKSLELIRSLVPQGSLLDVGCGRAAILRYVDARLTAYGIEIDKSAAEDADQFARERGGRVVHADAINGLKDFDENMFDGVLMRSYLEHEVDPRAALTETARTLRAGRYVIIKVPNFGSFNRKVRGNKWCGFRFPDHVNYFEPATLTKMIEECGLQVHKFGIADRLPSSDNMWMVARKAA